MLCSCGAEHPEGARYYVSVVDAGRVGLLAGPFDDHADALALVDSARALAVSLNPWAHFYAFGTVARRDDYRKPGLLNGQLGISP